MDGRGRVLVIDDDASFRFAMKKALGRLGFVVEEAAGGEAALTRLTGSDPPGAALLDLRMGDIDGLDVLRRSSGTSTRSVVLTGHGSVAAAVEAMKLGAFSFLEKPVDADVLAPLLSQAVAESRGQRSGESEFAPPLVGVSPAMEEVRGFIAQVGPTDATVAISGETGTGKEVVARRLHLASPRCVGPFVALNAACVPRELFESELFGHKKGAFTGATSDRSGLFREADGGTLFIDELGELPLESQAKLLRALETRTIRPVGEAREVSVDVRIIAATNRDLWAEVKAGRFREDLYFRLQVFPIVLPPMRDRVEDVVPLAEHLLTRLGQPGDAPAHTLSEESERALIGHDWPGNVRELLNVLRRASLFASSQEIDGALTRKMLAASVFAQPSAGPHTAAQPHRGQPSAPSGPFGEGGLEGAARDGAGAAPELLSVTSSRSFEAPMRLADVERQHIVQTLDQMGGNITRAATSLGIDRRTLQRKLRAYGIAGEE